MPNPFHYRAAIDNLWRQANSNAPAYRRLNALNAVERELFAPTDRATSNYRTYLATDPFDVARHKLRDLYDHDSIPPFDSEASRCPPLSPGEGWGEGSPVLPEQESPDEDDDPL